MRLFCFKTVSDPTNDNSVSGSNVPRDQLLKVARQTVIFFFFRVLAYIQSSWLYKNLFRRPLNDIRLLQFYSHAPNESDHILNPHIMDRSMIFSKPNFDIEKENKKEGEKNSSREKSISTCFTSRKWKRKKERKKRWNGRNRSGGHRKAFGTIFETVVVETFAFPGENAFDLFLLSATWMERVITLNSNFHVPFALHGLSSERRGEKTRRRAV